VRAVSLKLQPKTICLMCTALRSVDVALPHSSVTLSSVPLALATLNCRPLASQPTCKMEGRRVRTSCGSTSSSSLLVSTRCSQSRASKCIECLPCCCASSVRVPEQRCSSSSLICRRLRTAHFLLVGTLGLPVAGRAPASSLG
jgi:hypothetical protein